MNNIFVGNLSFQATKEDVIKLFATYGDVTGVVIVKKKNGKSMGYGFVEMPNDDEKNAAIAALDAKDFMDRPLAVAVVVPNAKGELKPKRTRFEKKEWKSNRDSKPWVKDQDTFKAKRQEEREFKSSNYGDRDKKPYKKFDGFAKSWDKPNQDSRGSKPEFKSEGGLKKSWAKSSTGSKPPFKKFDGAPKTWGKKDGASKTHTRPGEVFKKFHKVVGGSKVWPNKEKPRD